ncbi:MAG TPA: hypothetical protein VK922_16665 [Gemmatimonadaceae bacterium]|nr:hypothetical protein [Gemmatimonadaceae bacterium]
MFALSVGCVGANRGASDDVEAIRVTIVAQYDQLAVALRRLDLDGIMAVQDSAFSSVGTRGETGDYSAALEYTRRLVTTFDTIYHVQNRIRTFEVRGRARDTVVVDVCQELSRQQRLADGVPRRIDTSALQTETWIRRPAGWRRLRVENVRGTRWFVAGKRIDATQPYDPQAPPYVPANDDPTDCGLR